MIHIRDAFAILARGEAHPETLHGLIRDPIYVPQSMGALDLLAEMRAKRTIYNRILNFRIQSTGVL